MIGQISNRFCKTSINCDYIQLDICGLNSNESLEKLKLFKKNNSNITKIILHGDWTKKGFSENNILIRKDEYISTIKLLKDYVDIIGITIHPPFRNKINFKDFLDCCKEIEKYTDVFIENRSNCKIYLSIPSEIIDFSNSGFKMTLDIPQLLISCNYDLNLFFNCLNNINHKNIIEYHIANIVKKEKNTFVGRILDDKNGLLDYSKIIKYLNKDSFFTLEILGGINVFDKQQIIFQKMF